MSGPPACIAVEADEQNADAGKKPGAEQRHATRGADLPDRRANQLPAQDEWSDPTDMQVQGEDWGGDVFGRDADFDEQPSES